MTRPPPATRDRKGRAYVAHGQFMGRMAVHVYVTAAAKGQRREESARVVLVGHVPELRVAVDPWKAKHLDRKGALLLLWERLVQLVDDRVAPLATADAYLAAMQAEGVAPPPGPLHRPGLPKVARMILAYRAAHPAASQRMVAAAVGCDPARVCQVYRRYGDPAAGGAELRAESALNIQREFSADSAREHGRENSVSPETQAENRIVVPAANSAPPPCTSSSLREEDYGAPPTAAGVERPAVERPPPPVVAGHVESKPPRRQDSMPPALAAVPEELRPVVHAVMAITARGEDANAWRLPSCIGKRSSDLDRACTLGYLEERGSGTPGTRYWVPKHPPLVELVEALRASRRGAAS